MKKLIFGAGMALVLGLGMLQPAPAAAKLGSTLESSVKLSRTYKKDLMGVNYYLKGGVVVAETWNSEMSGWSQKKADELRLALMGQRKLKSRETNSRGTLFKYADGSSVQYNERRGTKKGQAATVITMDVASKAFTPTNPKSGKIEQVDDWKENPWKKRPW